MVQKDSTRFKHLALSIKMMTKSKFKKNWAAKIKLLIILPVKGLKVQVKANKN